MASRKASTSSSRKKTSQPPSGKQSLNALARRGLKHVEQNDDSGSESNEESNHLEMQATRSRGAKYHDDDDEDDDGEQEVFDLGMSDGDDDDDDDDDDEVKFFLRFF